MDTGSDKERRDRDSREAVMVRMSVPTKRRLAEMARRERRSMGRQAALLIERQLAAEPA